MTMNLPLLLPCLRVIRNDSNIDNHVVLKILISRNECVPAVVLKADAICGTFVKAIEILNSSYNRVSGIMREDLHPHWQSRSVIGGTIEQQLECDVLRRRTDWGNTVAGWSVVAVTLTNRRGRKAMTVKRHIVGHNRVTCRVLVQPLCLCGRSLQGLLRARRSWRVMG